MSGASSALVRTGRTSTATLEPPAAPAVMTPASRALLYGEDDDDDTPLTPEEVAEFNQEGEPEKARSQPWVTLVLALIVAVVVGSVGFLLWQTLELGSRPLPEPPTDLPAGDAPN